MNKKMRNNASRVIKKPKYLQDIDDNKSISRGSTPSRPVDNSSNHSRNSLNGKNQNLRGSNENKNSDYHYGSDFEEELSDIEKEKMEMDSRSISDNSVKDLESDLDSDMEGHNSELDNGFQDNDSNFVPFWKLGPAGTLGYRPQTPVPVWLQDRKYPDLVLPDSSDDLLIPSPYVLQAIGIYEVLRHFRTIVRLSPFHFEDFCASLIVNEQNILLTEIHIALLKAIIREEDSQNTHFGQLDQKESTNLSLCFVDSMTWPETLRVYLQSDSEFLYALKILDSCNYPFTTLVNKLGILQFLCDQFLQTSAAREDLLNEGKIKYDDYCRACHKPGDLLCCDSCSAVYHLECADPPLSSPDQDVEDWTCNVCNFHTLEGVTDCSSLMESSGLMCRQEPIGYDRHGRKYWFLVRRIIVESENGNLWYYSTLEQLDLLLLIMDGIDLEEALYVALKEFGDDIRRQMELTEKITEKARGSKVSAISRESDKNRKKIEEILEERKVAKEKEAAEGKEINESTNKENNEIKSENEDVAIKMKSEGGTENNEDKEIKMETKEVTENEEGKEIKMETQNVTENISKDSEPSNKELKSDDSVKEEIKEEVDSKLAVSLSENPSTKVWDNEALAEMLSIKIEQMRSLDGHLYRLGCNYNYRSYCNQYSVNNLALNRQQSNEERDKKRYLSNKFSINNTNEFKWSGQCYGTKENQVSTIRQTILNLDQSISHHFFHPHWHSIRKSWSQFVVNSITPQHFAKALIWIATCLKPAIFCTPWHESLGHIRLRRITALEREERKKQEKKDKKDSDDELRFYPFIKYPDGLKHSVWKIKGEEYRVHGQWGWQWISCLRKVNHVSMSKVGLRAGPTKITIPIRSQGNVIRGLPVTPSAYHQLAAKNPSMQFSLLSPKQRREELGEAESGKTKASPAATGQFEVSTVDLEEHFEDGVINVSTELNARLRLVYPKLSKESSLDSLLSRRLALKIQEERDFEKTKKVEKELPTSGDVGEKNSSSAAVDVENDSDDTLTEESDNENIDSIPASQCRVMANRPAGHLLKDMRLHKFKYEALDKFDEFLPCYSPSCRKNGRSACYSSSCILKERTRQKLVSTVSSYKIITSKPAPFDNIGSKSPVRLSDPDKGEEIDASEGSAEPKMPQNLNSSSNTDESFNLSSNPLSDNKEKSNVNNSTVKNIATDDESSNSQLSNSEFVKSHFKDRRTFSTEDPSGKVYLRKCSTVFDSKKAKKYKLPPIHLFKVNKSKMHSLFIIPNWELKVLARKGGRYSPSGFNPNAKVNPHFWPYPCVRPFFKVTFLYRINLANTINAVAYHLRLLWSCLRWDDMHEKGPFDGRKQVETDLEIIQTEILKRKIFGRFFEKTEYLRRKVTIPLDAPKPMREFTPSQRSGLRKRRKAQSPVNTQPESVEEWVEEERLELWEIKYFGERLEKAASISKRPGGFEKENNAFNQIYRNTSESDIKRKIEEHLGVQKGNINQKNIVLSNKDVVKVSFGGSNNNINQNINQKIVQGSSSIVTVGSKLPNVLSGRKIVTTKGGKIITVQSAGDSPSDGVAKVQLGKNSVIPISSLGKFQLSPQGNKIIRLQTVASSAGQQRTILPRNPTNTTNIIRPVNINSPISSSNSPAAIRPSQLQILKLPDGQLQIRGLQEGQQLLQRSDGKLTVINTKVNTGQTPIPQAPAQQAKIPISSKESFIRGLNPVSNNQIVKINGQQVILRTPPNSGKQVLNTKDVLGSLSTSDLKNLLNQGQLNANTTLQGTQPIKDSGSQLKEKQIYEEKVTKNSLPTPPASPSKSNSLSSQSSNTLTLRVQARMTEQGPKTIIQGLQPGVGLTKDHLMAIQQQVHSMVAQYNLQVNQLSPLMTLTLHVTSKNSQSTTPASNTAKSASGTVESTPKQLVNDIHNQLPYEEKNVLGKPLDYVDVNSRTASYTNSQVGTPMLNIPKGVSKDQEYSLSNNSHSTVSKGLKRLPDQYDDFVETDDNGISLPKSDTKKMKLDRSKLKRDREPLSVAAASSPTTAAVKSAHVVHDTKKRITKLQKLDGLLAKHKDLLKKDILKKRALLEKELQLQIHRELTFARQQMDKVKKSDSSVQSPKKAKNESTKLSATQSNTVSSNAVSPKAKKNDPSKLSSSNTLVTPPLDEATPVPKTAKTSSKSSKKSKQKSKKIVCICRTFFDDTKFYVGCDLCGNWFHGDCVGITEALSRNMTEYVCDDCANAKLNKDLFCFCKQPYDETQFYICCEKCEDWYHGKCVGIMQLEADDIDDYICPKCDPDNQWNKPCQKKLSNRDYGEIKKVIKLLTQHKNAWPFLEPVDKTEVPDYYKVVKIPMALKVIESNVYEKKYVTLFEFIRDVMLVFDNCRAYNPPNSSFCSCANTLEIFFCSKLKQLKQKVSQ